MSDQALLVEPGAVHVAVKPSVFRSDLRRFTVPAGQTVSELLAQTGIPEALRGHARVQIDGRDVSAEWYPRVKPKAGAVVSVLGCPAGSAGGKGGASLIPNDTARLFFSLLSFAGAAALPLLGLSGAALYAAQIGVSVAGVLVTNALIPPPVTDDEKEGYSISGTRNELNPFGAIPKVFGRVRIFPPFAAVPATETVENDQYVNLLLCLGYGPLKISEPRIGSTRVSDLEGVEYRSYPGKATDDRRTLYTTDVYEETFPVGEKAIGYADEWGHYELYGDRVEAYEEGAAWVAHENVIVHETAGNCTRFVIDLTFPQGLLRRIDNRNDPWKVNFHVQIRPAGARAAGTEDTGWVDVIPDVNAVIRNEQEDLPTTLDRLYDWIEDMLPGLQEFTDLLNYAIPQSEQVSGIERLEDLVASLEEALHIFGLLSGAIEPGKQEAYEELLHQMGLIIEGLQAVEEGTPGPDMSAWLDEAGCYSNIFGALLEVNRILAQGYALPEDEARITNALVRAMIFRQGITGIFAKPAVGGFTCVDRRPGVVRFGVDSSKYTNGIGRWEIRLRRTSEETDNDTIIDKAYWTALRTYQSSVRLPDGTYSSEPFFQPRSGRVAMAELRLKAGEHVSGVLDQFSCVVEAELPAWDPEAGAWTDASVTNGHNPAWCFAEVLRGPGAKKPVSDDRLDLDNLAEWAAYCTEQGFRVDTVVDEATTTLDLLRKIAACGRAAFSVQNGKFGVVMDRPQESPVQVFTARNCRNFTASRAYRDLPHALKVRCTDADAEWQKGEFLVYADGYAETADATHAAAETFEDLELWGIVDSHNDGKPGNSLSQYYTGLAYKHGRYALAQITLRPEVFEFETDAEGPLLAVRGARVKVQHDVIKVGLGSGRIVSVDETGVDVDWPVVMAAGKEYACRVRRKSGNLAEIALQTSTGTGTRLAFTAPFVNGSDPLAPGDLVWYGESGRVDFDCIVKSVSPDKDFGARITCVPYNEALYAADTGEIPPYNPGITQPPDIQLVEPPAPDITGVQSDETVLVRLPDGTLQTRILVSLKSPETAMPGGHRIAAVQVHFRPLLDLEAEADPNTAVTVRDSSWHVFQVAVDGFARDLSIAPVADGDWYEFRVRYVTNRGVAGAWTRWPAHYVIGKTTPPPNVDTLLFEGNRLRWFYPTPPLDLAGFKVRFCHGVGATWDAATPAHDGVQGATFFDFNALSGGTLTFFVKAVDVMGNESERAAVAFKNLGSPALGRIVSTDDHRVLEWPAEKTGCVLDEATGDLAATEEAALFWPADGLAFWRADDALFWGSTFDAMEYVVAYTPDPDMLPAVVKLETEIEGTAFFVEWLQDAGAALWPELVQDPLWPTSMDYDFWPLGSSYQAWPGEVDAEAQTYFFRVRVAGGLTQGRIAQFKVHLDTKAKHESVDDFVVDDLTTGNRVTLRNEFRAIASVQVSIQQDAGYANARTVEVLDKDPELGPLVRVYDASHNPVAGKIDVDVWGY